MPSSSGAPYNITISNDSPTITYFPYRDGPTSGGWNLTCANSVDLTWIPQSFCVGQSSHRTSYVGASLLIEFEGTAAYLYGQTDGAFVTQLDDQINSYPSARDPSVDLLAKSEGLSFGKHKLSLNVTQSAALSFWKAVLTIRVGTGNNAPSSLQNRTVIPFNQSNDGLTTLNPQFTYTGTWDSNAPGPIGAIGTAYYPRQHTAQTNAYMTFKLENTSAFFIYGLVTFDLGLFSATLTPPNELGPSVTTFYNSNAHWIGLDRVMYWGSGMDRDKEYSVRITNLGQGTMPWWDFSHIDIIDAGATSNSTSSSGGGGPSGKHHNVPVAVIGGAVGGIVLVFVSLILGFLYYRKAKRPNSEAKNMDFTGQPGLPKTTQLYNPALPILPHQPRLPPSQPYQISGGYIVEPWDGGQPSAHVGVNQNVLDPQMGGRLVYQEEDAGTLAAPGEEVVRLPPQYKEAWSQGDT